MDYSLADQKSSILLKAAKSAVPVAPKIVSSTPSPPSGDGDDKNSFELEGRPLPRPAASSSYQRKKPKAYLKEGSSGAIAAAKVEAQERNKYLRKFYPIDDPRVGQVDFFGLDPDVMAKATAKGLKLTPTAFGVTKAGQKGKKGHDHEGGGEYSGEDEDDSGDDDDDDDEDDEDDEDDATNEAEEDLGSIEGAVAAALKDSKGATNYGMYICICLCI